MNKKIKKETGRDDGIDRKLRHADQTVLCYQIGHLPFLQQAKDLYAGCVVWDKSVDAIMDVLERRTGMVTEDIQ